MSNKFDYKIEDLYPKNEDDAFCAEPPQKNQPFSGDIKVDDIYYAIRKQMTNTTNHPSAPRLEDIYKDKNEIDETDSVTTETTEIYSEEDINTINKFFYLLTLLRQSINSNEEPLLDEYKKKRRSCWDYFFNR